jgi:hypothetical protein
MEPPVPSPALVERFDLLGWRDAESAKREDQGPHCNVRLCGFADMPAPRASDGGRPELTVRSNAVKQRVELGGQFNQLFKRQVSAPPRPQDV